jgi:UDP-3-O-[3-hydroxymyristoyl] glucosamine N-acyltransferase
VDRPAVGETRIGAGTKIDNLVQVAHGVKIGRHSLLAGQSGVAGSSELGEFVTLAGQAGVTGHVRVGRGSVVGAKSVVSKDIEPEHHVTGIPAVDVEQWRESVAALRRLPELRKTLLELEARLSELESRLPKGPR